MKPITDLTTDAAANNPSALAINKHWGPCRNDLFREFQWSFANVIEPMEMVLTVTQDDDYPEWASFYTYTENAATIWHVFDESTVKTKSENQFEVVYNPTLNERLICCDLSTYNAAWCEYTYNVTDTLLWDTKFIMAFSYRLASAICMELTGDAEKALKLTQLYNAILHEAKRIDSREKKSKPTQSNPIVDARG